jgi:hypothetical protein
MRTKCLIILLSLLSYLVAQDLLEMEFKGFSNEQREVLLRAYELGLPFDFGYTMAAIAWQESMAGKYLLNLQDPSAGVFHNNLKSVIARHEEFRDTDWQRNLIAQRLIQDMDFSAAEALAELEYWKSIHGEGNWFLIWQSYNGGFAFQNPDSQAYAASSNYARRLKEKINFLMRNKVFK